MNKKCTKCKKLQYIQDFPKDSRYKGGRSTWCRSCCNKKSARHQIKYRKENRPKIKNSVLQNRYGIWLEEYNIMFIDQKGCCAICSLPQSNFTRRFAVDHCHLTGKVRGLLCAKCNTALGQF